MTPVYPTSMPNVFALTLQWHPELVSGPSVKNPFALGPIGVRKPLRGYSLQDEFQDWRESVKRFLKRLPPRTLPLQRWVP
jgi:hypothetical protein